MITHLQKSLLEAAARRPRFTEGSIAWISAIAVVMGDIDTLRYIQQNYRTLDHFDEASFALLDDVVADMEIGEPVGSA